MLLLLPKYFKIFFLGLLHLIIFKVNATELILCESVTSGKCIYKDSTNSFFVPENEYCQYSNKLYVTNGSLCNVAYNNSDGDAEAFLLTKGTGTYKKGTFGIDSGLIYSCNKTKCGQLTSTYYLHTTTDSSGKQKNYLYSCDDEGICEYKKSIAKGFYVSGVPKITSEGTTYSELIECIDTNVNKCEVIGNSSIINGYYVSGGDNLLNQNYLIKCSNNACFIVESGGTDDIPSYHINGYYGSTIIMCYSSYCESLSSITMGIYISRGNNIENEHLILCGSWECKYITSNSDCKTNEDIGNIYFKNENEMSICVTPDSSLPEYLELSFPNKFIKYYLLPGKIGKKVFENEFLDDNVNMLLALDTKDGSSLYHISEPLIGDYFNDLSFRKDHVNQYILCNSSGCEIYDFLNQCENDTVGQLVIVYKEPYACTGKKTPSMKKIVNFSPDDNQFIFDNGFLGTAGKTIVIISDKRITVGIGTFLNKNTNNELTLNISRCYMRNGTYKCTNEIATNDDYYCIVRNEYTEIYQDINGSLEKVDVSYGLFFNQKEVFINSATGCSSLHSFDLIRDETCEDNDGTIVNKSSPSFCRTKEDSIPLIEQNYGLYYHPSSMYSKYFFNVPDKRDCILEISKNSITLDAILPSSLTDIFGVHLFIKKKDEFEEGEFGVDSGMIYICDYAKCTKLVSQYYLYEGKSESTGSDVKYLYYCDNTGICAIFNTTAEEYYLALSPVITTERIKVDGTKEYSLTMKNKLLECKDSKFSNCVEQTSPKMTTIPYHILNTITNSPSAILIKSTSNGYEKGKLGKDSGILYACEFSKCIQLKSTYYIYKEVNANSNEVNTYFYYCNSKGETTIVDKTVAGYYTSIMSVTNINDLSNGERSAVVSNTIRLIRCEDTSVENCREIKSKEDDSQYDILLSYMKKEALIIVSKDKDDQYTIGKLGENSGNIYLCKSYICTQLISTYYLYSDDKTNEDTDKRDTNKYLYYCDKNGKCTVEHAISVGYYLNDIPTSGTEMKNGAIVITSSSENVLIECSSDTIDSCSVVENPDDDTLTIFNYIDNIIGLSPKTLLLAKDKQYDDYIEGDLGEDEGIIYDCKLSKCARLISTYYVYHDESDGVPDNTFYQCDNTGICSISEPEEVGFYLGGASSTMINDEGKKEKIYPELIQCQAKSGSSCEIWDDIENSHFISALENGNNLIKCLNSECKLISSGGAKTKKVYYVDGEDDYNYIECDNTKCISIKNESILIIITNRDDVSEEFILCDPQCKYSVYVKEQCRVTLDIGSMFIDNGEVKFCTLPDKKVPVWTVATFADKMHYYLLPKRYVDTIFKYLKIPEDGLLIRTTPQSSIIDCFPKPTYGYYINQDESKYISCNYKGCKNATLTDSCDSNSIPGSLALIEEEDNKEDNSTVSYSLSICTNNYPDNRVQIKDDSDDNEYYFIEKGFPGSEDNKAVISFEESSVIVKIGDFFNKDKDDTGNDHVSHTVTKCSMVEAEYKCIDEKANLDGYYYDESKSELYFVTDTELESMEDKLPGYYINQGEVIIISGKSNSTTVVSKTSPISDLDTYYRCDSGSVGKLYNSKTPMLCLDGIYQVELSDKDNGTYLVSYSIDNIYDIPEGQYGLVNISKNKAILDVNRNETDFCASKSMSVEVLTQSCDGKTVKCNNGYCQEFNPSSSSATSTPTSTNDTSTSYAIKGIPIYIKKVTFIVFLVSIIFLLQ